MEPQHLTSTAIRTDIANHQHHQTQVQGHHELALDAYLRVSDPAVFAFITKRTQVQGHH